MANSVFNALGGNNTKLPGPFGNIQEIMSKLNQFRQSFQGDPKQQVQQLLNKEIKEFIQTLYSGTDTPEERKLIHDLIRALKEIQ